MIESEQEIIQAGHKRARAVELLVRLCNEFPNAFVPPEQNARLVPLSIGVHKEIRARYPEQTNAIVATAMRIYTQRMVYQKALLRCPQRVCLDGTPGGEITERQREVARERLERANSKKRATQRSTRPVDPKTQGQTPATRPPDETPAPEQLSADKLAALKAHFAGGE